MKPETVGREPVDGTGAVVAVRQRVVRRELPLPDVHPMLAVGLELASPWVDLVPESAPSCVLPLGLGRKPGSGPGAVVAGIVVRDMNHRVIEAPIDRRLGALGMLPGRTLDRAPPRRLSDPARRWEVVGQEPAEDERPSEPLGVGHITARLDERCEALV
jgi:hypothetical protein